MVCAGQAPAANAQACRCGASSASVCVRVMGRGEDLAALPRVAGSGVVARSLGEVARARRDDERRGEKEDRDEDRGTRRGKHRDKISPAA